MAGTGDDDGFYDPAEGDDTNLGDVAAAGLGDIAGGGVQESLDGSEYNTHVGLHGMGYRTEDTDFKLGERRQFTVTGYVRFIGDERMKDHDRHVVKVQVDTVEPVETQ